MCSWASSASGGASCGPFNCSTVANKTGCNTAFNCQWSREVGSEGACISQGGTGPTPVDIWRDDLDTIVTDGHWYSTQGVSECSGANKGLPCTWRVAAVESVKLASCVNAAMVSAVLSRNASCFAGCPRLPPHAGGGGSGGGGSIDTKSDCYIRCLFDGLLGNSSTGAPPLHGTGNATGRALIRAFENAFLPEDQGGCPELPHGKEAADPPPEPGQLVGVRELALYTLTHAGNLSNGNAGDAAGAAMALLSQMREAAAGRGGTRGETVASIGVYVGPRVTRVKAELNSLFGEFTRCRELPVAAAAAGAATLTSGATMACAPDWHCMCMPREGDNDPPHCHTLFEDNPCECASWGGCPINSSSGSGHHHSTVNAGVISVGWRSTRHWSVADVTDHSLHSQLSDHWAEQHVSGNLYSTMEGGDCDLAPTPPLASHDVKLCSWRQLPANTAQTSASRACLEITLVRHLTGMASGTPYSQEGSSAWLASAWEESFDECVQIEMPEP